MEVSRPKVLKIGDRVRFDGVTQTVTGASGTLVRLTEGSVRRDTSDYDLAAVGLQRGWISDGRN